MFQNHILPKNMQHQTRLKPSHTAEPHNSRCVLTAQACGICNQIAQGFGEHP